MADYSAEVLVDAPDAYWRLGEAAGATTATDASGNGRSGTYNGPVTLGAVSLVGGGGTSADFAPTSWMAVPGASWMDSANFTAEVWFKPDSVSGYQGLISRDSSGSGRLWTLYLLNGQLHVYNGAAGSGVLTGSKTMGIGGRHHAVITYSGTTLSIYLDGVLDAQATVTLPTASATTPMLVGASYGGVGSPTFGFDGLIDEAAFYHTALSAARIAKHYSTGIQNYPWTLLQDNFDRANSTNVPGAPQIGGPYTARVGTWGINTNGLYTSVSTAKSTLTFPASVDVDFQAKATLVTGARVGLVVRWVDNNNFWMASKDNNAWQLAHYSGGVYSNVAAGPTWVTGDLVRIVAVGRMLYLYVNGKLAAQVEDSFYASATAICGFHMDAASASYRWDDALAVDSALPAPDGSVATLRDPAMLGSALQTSSFLYRGRDSKSLDQIGVS